MVPDEVMPGTEYFKASCAPSWSRWNIRKENPFKNKEDEGLRDEEGSSVAKVTKASYPSHPQKPSPLLCSHPSNLSFFRVLPLHRQALSFSCLSDLFDHHLLLCSLLLQGMRNTRTGIKTNKNLKFKTIIKIPKWMFLILREAHFCPTEQSTKQLALPWSRAASVPPQDV